VTRASSATEVARSQKAPCTGKLSKRPDSTWAGLLSSQESLRRFLPRHSVAAVPRPQKIPGKRFLRQAESIGPMGLLNHLNPRPECRLPLVGPRSPVKERDGRSALCSSSATSSDRLFLDRVARQHCPSPLHRHGQTNTHPLPASSKQDISTLQRIGHFYFALTQTTFFLTVSVLTGYNPVT
jgi:hypothetical protein